MSQQQTNLAEVTHLGLTVVCQFWSGTIPAHIQTTCIVCSLPACWDKCNHYTFEVNSLRASWYCWSGNSSHTIAL